MAAPPLKLFSSSFRSTFCATCSFPSLARSCIRVWSDFISPNSPPSPSLLSSSSIMASSQTYLLPGQPLPAPSSSSSAQRLQASSGTYARSTYTLSSLIGQPSFSKTASKKSGPSTTKASIHTPLAPLLRLPEPDSLVLARVTRITSRQAVCSILLVLPDPSSSSSSSAEAAGSLSLSQALASGAANHAAGEDPAGLDFSGVIRQQDVRLTETDKVKVAECFRVGDLVRARVVSCAQVAKAAHTL